MASNFDFNGDSLLPEQDNLFDELLDDLAFETDMGTFDNNFLDFDFGNGLLDNMDGSGGAMFDGATLPGPASSSGQPQIQPPQTQPLQPPTPQYVFSFGGDIIEQQPPQIRQRTTPAGGEFGFNPGSAGSNPTTGVNHKRKKASADTAAKPHKKSTDVTVSTTPVIADHLTDGQAPQQPASLLSSAKISVLTQLPVNLLKAFNGGDIQKVREIVREHTSKTCALKTPALDNELFGHNYICDFFESVYDSHPDAVWVAKKSKYVPERCEVSCRIYFAGTRVAQGSKGTDLSGAYSDYLFKKKGSSLLDEMDVSALTEAEIAAMRELENLGCNLSVFGKGNMTLLVDEESGKNHEVFGHVGHYVIQAGDDLMHMCGENSR